MGHTEMDHLHKQWVKDNATKKIHQTLYWKQETISLKRFYREKCSWIFICTQMACRQYEHPVPRILCIGASGYWDITEVDFF